ncbi:MAG: hypothetical protein EOP48_01295 [Sphingobacteriales bacterium]|nr:MAG: hypothetical protein EOP48_01295 [Sphingobacteriales bacterium]
MAAIPRESIIEIPRGLAEGIKAVEQRLLPVTGSSSYVSSSTLSGHQIKFRIEQQSQTFLDPQSLCIGGRVSFSNLGTVKTQIHQILGSILSAFSKISVKSNEFQLESVEQLGPLYNRLFDATLDKSAKTAMSSLLLFDPISGEQGAILNTNQSTGTSGDNWNGFKDAQDFTFCIPLQISSFKKLITLI